SDDAVIVDMHGTGNSCMHLFQWVFQIRPVYLLVVSSGEHEYAMVRKKVGLDGIEKMNYDLVGALYDVQNGKPLRAKPEYPLKWVIPSHACIEKCVEMISDFKLDPFDVNVIDWAASSMEEGLAIDRYLEHARHHSHVVHEGKLKHFRILKNGFFYET